MLRSMLRNSKGLFQTNLFNQSSFLAYQIKLFAKTTKSLIPPSKSTKITTKSVPTKSKANVPEVKVTIKPKKAVKEEKSEVTPKKISKKSSKVVESPKKEAKKTRKTSKTLESPKKETKQATSSSNEDPIETFKIPKPKKEEIFEDEDRPISSRSTEELIIDKLVLGNSSANIKKIFKCNVNLDNPYDDYLQEFSSARTKDIIFRERNNSCNNYSPLPVVLEHGNGIFVQDVDGFIYIDFLSAYSSLNFGHCNKQILESIIKQSSKLHMTSRAFYNNLLHVASQKITSLFRYQKVLFANSGVEAGEAAVKFARRWGYRSKGVEENKAQIIFMKGNFWGRTIAACASSDDPKRYNQFGPYGDLGFDLINYNDLKTLEEKLEANKNIVGVFFEPIQGENGVIIPQEDFCEKVRELCDKYNVLMIADEIQTGLYRTGNLMQHARNGVPLADLTLLGKSLSGGFYPVSAVLGNNKVFQYILPGDHGSTYGGNPLACQTVISTLDYIDKNKKIFDYVKIKSSMISCYIYSQYKFVKEIRARGLLVAIELFEDAPINAYELSLILLEKGLLCKPSKSNIIRLAPPLTINEYELYCSIKIIRETIQAIENDHPTYNPPSSTKFDFEEVPNAVVMFCQDRLEGKLPKTCQLSELVFVDDETKI